MSNDTTDKGAVPADATRVTYSVDSDVIAEAVANGVAACEPIALGDHGQLFLLPVGYTPHLVDVSDLEDSPRFREGAFEFVGVRSIAGYVNRYKTDDSLGFIKDVYGVGVKALVADLRLAEYVLDEHPADLVRRPARRKHVAVLVLRPTTAARRWGAVLDGKVLSQEGMLDLIVDGIGEIAQPDGSTLRDLISDLHAIRTTEARSVIRTGGQASIEVADNVQLHAGVGTKVEVPETITVTFAPFAGIPGPLVLKVMIKPQVQANSKVAFTLHAPTLDDDLARIIGDVAEDLEGATDIAPLWVP